MEKIIKTDLSKYQYIRATQFFFDNPSNFGLRSPVRKNTFWFFPFSLLRPDLPEIASTVGINENDKALAAHTERYRKYRRLSSLLGFISYAILVIILMIFVIFLITTVSHAVNLPITNQSSPTFKFTQFILYVLFVPTCFSALQITDRITSTIINRYYADTLSFVSCLYLIIQLSFPESFHKYEDRLVALKRVRTLKNIIVLLSYQFASPYVRTNDRAGAIFKNMELFVEDVEQQIIVSNPKSQQKALNQLLPFMKVLLSNQYGEFKYTQKPTKSSEKIQRKSNSFSKALGIFVPLLFFTLLAIYPNSLQFTGIDNKIIALIN